MDIFTGEDDMYTQKHTNELLNKLSQSKPAVTVKGQAHLRHVTLTFVLNVVFFKCRLTMKAFALSVVSSGRIYVN